MKKYPQLDIPFYPSMSKLVYSTQGVYQVAIKKKMKKGVKKSVAPVATKKSAAPSKKAEDTAGKKQIVLHLDPRVHGAAKITAQALGTNISVVLRKLIKEWTLENKKAAIEFLSKGASFDDVEDEDEDVEVEEDTDVEEDADEDEDEDEDVDEDEDEE